MDRYQKTVMSEIYFSCTAQQSKKESKESEYGVLDEENDLLTIMQDENITITKYNLLIDDSNSVIGKLSVLRNSKWHNIEGGSADCGGSYMVEVNFEDKIEAIKIAFANNIIDDYVLNISYVDADKEKYYEKQKKQKLDEMLKAASIDHAIDYKLVNIYFQPCCAEYERTEIMLYRENQLLAKFDSEPNVYYKAIDKLAFGKYEYVVKQYAAGDTLLIETAKRSFNIPLLECYGGSHHIIMR